MINSYINITFNEGRNSIIFNKVNKIKISKNETKINCIL